MSEPLAELFRAGKARVLEEALSVLYVGMTRARHWLELIVPEVLPRQRKASAAHLLREALRRSGGVKKKAAALLRISFRSFRYRLEKLGLEDGDADGSG